MIGQPLNRVEGPLKVTGRATYADEERGVGQPLYGFIVGATIGRGRISRIDATRAERAPGVRRVMTHRNAPAQHRPDMSVPSSYSRALPVLSGNEVAYFGQPVALVIADTFEQARAAAVLVEVSYEIADGRYDFDARAGDAYPPQHVNAGIATDSSVGDFDKAFAAAPIQIDESYATPYMFSQPLEPHNCLAAWEGDVVTLHASSQILSEGKKRIAATFGLDPKQVRVISRYVGGGFGSKLGLHSEAILAVMAARDVRRPVKVAMTRQQMFQVVGNRAASRQRVRLGAQRDGRLTAFAHEVLAKISTGDDYVEQTAATGRALYAAPHRRTSHRVVALDLPLSEDVRAPGDAPGLMAIESAMDALAYELDIDPIELRIRNEPKLDPERGVPFSQRRMVQCMREGARRFGWERRPKRPATLADGRWLIGYGMAAAIRGHFQLQTSVKVRMEGDGSVLVQSDMTDIGTGTYTILTQLAAEDLGVPIERVHVELGDSNLPTSAGSGGSFGATNSCMALVRACHALRDEIFAAVGEEERTPAANLAALVAKNLPNGVEAIGSIKNMWEERNYKAFSVLSFGAHFAEVAVDMDTAEVRLRRMLGVFDAGRIFNAKTARSQLIGGMAWGVSMALYEEGVVDTRVGAFINRDFAQYLVPVHADIPAIDATFLDGFDDTANELGAKGLGEIGTCGSGAAVANAVYNATGVRVREFPITIEKLLPQLPLQAAR